MTTHADHPYQRVTIAQVETMSRAQCIAWLQWNDPNGTYSDTACEVEGFDRLSLDEARDLMTCQILDALPVR